MLWRSDEFKGIASLADTWLMHHTKDKGDLAVAKVIADLVENGYSVFLPISEHQAVDLIAYKAEKCYRIQVKFSTHGTISKCTGWSDRNGSHRRLYSNNDFDYYAIWLPDIKRVVYPSINFAGQRIRTRLPNSYTPFFWYEDFVGLVDNAPKRTLHDFGVSVTYNRSGDRLGARKVDRPTKQELSKLVWEQPSSVLCERFGVTDKAIQRWCVRYGIDKPPRGYWQKQKTCLSTGHGFYPCVP